MFNAAIGNLSIQAVYVDIGPSGTVERDIPIPGFRIRNPSAAAVTVTVRQSPGQPANVPDLFAVKVTNVTGDAVHVKVRRIDANGGHAMPIGLSIIVIE